MIVLLKCLMKIIEKIKNVLLCVYEILINKKLLLRNLKL